VFDCDREVKKKPCKSLTYKAFESVLAVWTIPV